MHQPACRNQSIDWSVQTFSKTGHLQLLHAQVELVLTAIEQRWSRNADPSQVRYFIFKVGLCVMSVRKGHDKDLVTLHCSTVPVLDFLLDSVSSVPPFTCQAEMGLKTPISSLVSQRQQSEQSCKSNDFRAEGPATSYRHPRIARPHVVRDHCTSGTCKLHIWVTKQSTVNTFE